MKHPSLQYLLSGLIGTLILSACAPSAASPTGPSAEEMQATIHASVALTLTAHAQTRVAAWSPTPMDTPTPTVTATPIFPTLTPFPTSTPFTPFGGGVSPTPVDYACAVVSKFPLDDSIFKPNKDFDVKFFLRNVGRRRWDKGADLSYHEGAKMVANFIYELPKVEPGETVGPFIFDAKSPNKQGTYTTTFKLQGGFCYPTIRIIVKK